MKNERGKNILLGVLIVGLVTMTVAYAALIQRLDINGEAKVAGATWSIKFENGSKGTNVGAGEFDGTPSLTDTAITNVKAVLHKPGDKVVYNFDIHNSGDLDAIIGTLKKAQDENGDSTIVCTDSSESTTSADATLVCSKTAYDLKYTSDGDKGTVLNGKDIAEGDTLKAGEKVSAQLTIEFEDSTSIPTNDVTITGLNSYIIYTQN